MRQRALIHIDGPSGAGKTALVEALLAHADDMISVARCVRDDGLAAPRESLDDPAGEPSELSRYRAAGAHAAVRYSFPGGDDDTFFHSDLMQDYSHAVVMEGDRPVNVADLTVFVVPATAGRLLVRRRSDQRRRDRPALDAMTAVLGQPGGMEAVLGHLLGPGLGDLAGKHPELVEQERRKAFGRLTELRQAPPAKAHMRWAVAAPYRGIESAQLVVINVRHESDNDDAEALLADVVRLRNDDAVFADILAPLGRRVPITAVVADLTQPAEPGTKKALARIRRVIRSIG
jgi:hypothetical protein